MESPFVGAGFQLSSADVLIEVPFDPKLDMLFVGEEILYSARLWTKGWDMYAPDMNLVWHHYNRCSPASEQQHQMRILLQNKVFCCLFRVRVSITERPEVKVQQCHFIHF